MNTFITLSLVTGLIVFASCSNNPKPIAQQQETPKALQDNNEASSDIYSKKRYNSDIVDALYEELASKDPALKDLETRIGNLPGKKSDSLLEYQHFKEKNESYYSSANNHASGIQDSVLRQKIKMMIETSGSKFNNKISGIKDIISRIEKNELSINDAHIYLKIILTGPVMAKYQNENMPSPKPIESVAKESDNILKKAIAIGGN